MPLSFFDKLNLCLKPAELMPLICGSFSKKELVRLIASAGCVYPGVRMETLDPEELALGWIEDAWKDPEVFEGLVQALDKAHEKDVQEMRLSSAQELEHLPKLVADICREREISGLLWALLRDERSDAVLVRRFLDAFYRVLDKGIASFKKREKFEDHLWQGRLTKKETERVRCMLMDLVDENKKLKRGWEKSDKDKNKMIQQIAELKKKTTAGEVEITALKNALAGLRKEAARKDMSIRELEHRAKTISREEENSLRRRIHDLERSERKLQHEIGELQEKLPAVRLEAQKTDGLCRELQRSLQGERLKNEHLEQDIKRLVLEAHSREQTAPARVEKPSSPPKEKGKRLGIFVDTRHLWQVSRFQRQKIDYQKLLEFIVLDRHLVKAVAYVMTLPDIDSSGFLSMLEKNGFQVRTRPLLRLPDGSLHGGWDAGIAADVISSSEKLSLDIIHLVSGNEDFTDLLKLLKTRGLKAEVSAFKITAAPELERAADEFIPLDAEVFKE